VLDINLPQRKVSVGGGGIGIGLAGPPSPVIRNGFSVYDPPVSVISSRHSNFNGQGGVGGGGALAAGPGATASGVGIATTNRGRLSISAAGGPLIASSSSAAASQAPGGGAGGGASGLGATTGAGAVSVSGSLLGEPAGGSGSAPTIGGTAPPNQPGPKRQGSFSNVFSKLIDGMPAGTMFAKFKSTNVAASTAPQSVADGNPITQYFEIGKPVACAGPELVWRIHDAYRKSDNKVSGPRPQPTPKPKPKGFSSKIFRGEKKFLKIHQLY